MSHYWIDTDPGLDDAVAILLAVREVGADLVGISTVQGNEPEDVCARNLTRIVTAFDARGLLPAGWQPRLVRGAQLPLGRERIHGGHFHGPDGLGGLEWQADARWEGRYDSLAPQALLEAVRAWPDLTLACIGPLTNLAMAVQLDPDIAARLSCLVIMGGSLRAGGNASLAAEFNFAADPEAAKIVLNAGFRDVRLVPMDACLSACMTKAELARLEASTSQGAAAALELLSHWRSSIERERGFPVYDPSAWLLATRPELAVWEELFVTVDTGHDAAHGASLADWRQRSGRPPNLKAAMHIDPAAAFDRMLELLS